MNNFMKNVTINLLLVCLKGRVDIKSELKREREV